MTRSEFVQLSNVEYQKAAYRMLSPIQKQEIWTTKIKEVLKLDWETQELKHLEELYFIIDANQRWFADDVSESVKDEMQVATYRWKEYASEVLKWDISLIYSIIADPNTLLDTKGTLTHKESISLSVKTRNESGGVPDCECSTSSDWCDSRIYCTTAAPCNKKGGCGTLWLYECDGRCLGVDAITYG